MFIQHSKKAFVLATLMFMAASFLMSDLKAQKTGETVKDTTNGIQFKAPKEWVSIPVDPTEHIVIHKFQAKRPDEARKVRGYRVTASLDVMFFRIATPKTGDATPEKKSRSILPSGRYKNYEDYMKKALRAYELQGKPSKKKIKGVPVTYYDLIKEVKFQGKKEPVLERIMTCVYHTDMGEIAFQFNCLDSMYKKRHKSAMASSIRTLKFIEKEDATAKNKAMSELSANERYIQEQVDKLSSGWYHFWSKKKNYVIFSNADKSFSREIAKNLEGIHDCYVKAFPEEPRIKWIPIVRVCKTKNEYHGYGGPDGSAGYWSDYTKEFVFYNDVARGIKNTILVLKHEAFHHFIHFYLGCRLSTWMDEGCAEYFAGGEFVGKNIKIKPNTWRRGTIQTALVNNAHVPMKKFLHMTKDEYYAQSSLCYAQGWSVIYFLWQGRKQGARMDKEWSTIPNRYIKNLRAAFEKLEEEKPDLKADKDEVNYKLANAAIKIAMAKTFDGWTDEDWERLEKSWIDFSK